MFVSAKIIEVFHAQVTLTQHSSIHSVPSFNRQTES